MSSHYIYSPGYGDLGRHTQGKYSNSDTEILNNCALHNSNRNNR